MALHAENTVRFHSYKLNKINFTCLSRNYKSIKLLLESTCKSNVLFKVEF